VDGGTTLVQRVACYQIDAYLCPSDASAPADGLWASGSVPAGKTEVGKWAFTNYSMNFQVFGDVEAGNDAGNNMDGKATFASIRDGTSNTLASAEVFRRCGNTALPHGNLWGHGNWNVPWMPLFAYGTRDGVTGFTSNANPPGIVGPASKPQENPNPWNAACDRMRNQSQHPGGLQVGLVDGSARFISASIDANAWWAMCTIGGGETLRD
jgi:hypothetical protein